MLVENVASNEAFANTKDELIRDFEAFLTTSLSREPSWSDLIIHGSLETSEGEIGGRSWWKLPDGWHPVVTEEKKEVHFTSIALQYFLEQYRSDPTMFANGDSHRLAISIDKKYRLRLVFFTMNGNRDQFALECRRVERNPIELFSLGAPSEWVASITQARKGLYLIVGPTCSGKTTTCYSVLDHFNKQRRAHILTIEDPIENILTSQNSVITQTEIGPNGASFASAMNGALVKAPNIILIGEIKDHDTATAALQAANSGHLVLGTLHVDNCETAVERFLTLIGNSDSARKEVAATLCAVLGQAIVPVNNAEKRQLVCDSLMVADGSESSSLRTAIEQGNIDLLRDAIINSSNGSRSMNSTLLDLVKAKKATVDDALNAATNRMALRTIFQKFGIK